MIEIKYLGPGIGFNGYEKQIVNNAPFIVRIECSPKSCRKEYETTMCVEACQYLEQFTRGQKLTPNVCYEIATEADNNGVTYISHIILQIILE